LLVIGWAFLERNLNVIYEVVIVCGGYNENYSFGFSHLAVW
jgi:hypothetical protein